MGSCNWVGHAELWQASRVLHEPSVSNGIMSIRLITLVQSSNDAGVPNAKGIRLRDPNLQPTFARHYARRW